MNNETQDGQENLPPEPVQEVTPANPAAEGIEAPAPKVRKPRTPKAEATGEEPPKRVRKPKAAVVAAETEPLAASAELPVAEAAETFAPAEAVAEAVAEATDASTPDAPAREDDGAPTERRARPKRGARSDDGEARTNRGKLVPISDEPVDGLAFDDVIAGALDVEESPDAPGFPKRVLPPQPEAPKLHKVLAQAGLGSRLEMERLIAEGRISVNDEAAHVGQRIQWGDKLRVNGKLLRLSIAPPRPRVLAYHKPAGEVVTHDDPQNRPTVFRKMPRLQQGKWQSVGRLDLNTEGLLLFTNSGELANRLMHPSFGLEREYAVRVLGALSNDEKDKLLGGVQLDDGMAQFGSIEEGGGEGANHWYKVTISEGRNREVRRMIESVGHAVSRLIRIRYGVMQLPRGLRRGFYMELGDRDIQALAAAVGLDLQQAAPQQQGQPRDDRKDQARNRGLRRSSGPDDGYRPQQQDQGYPADDYDEDFAPEQSAQNAGEQPAPGFAPAPRSNDNKTRRTPFGRKRGPGGPGGDERAAPRARTDDFAPREERQAPRARPEGYPPRDGRPAPRGRSAGYGQRDDRQMPRGRPDGYAPRDEGFNARDSEDDFSQRGVSHESPFDQKSSRKRIFSTNNEVPSIIRASRSGGGAYGGPARGAAPSRGRSQGGDGDSDMPKGIDPMKTRFGFIGGDSFNNAKRSGGNGRGRSQGGGGSGGGGARSGGGGRSGGGQSRGFGGKR